MAGLRSRPVVAIDGPAGVGKSTVARRVAERLGCLYIDTGAMYRAVTLKALREGIPVTDEEALTRAARKAVIDLADDGGRPAVFLDGQDVTAPIRLPEVEANVSRVAAVAGVREAMVSRQRALAGGGGVVLDGRDAGTYIVPDAERKFFLTATPSARADRRYRQLLQGGRAVSAEGVRRDLEERDRLDCERPVAPLRPADDAIVIDTTDLAPDEVVDTIVAHCHNCLNYDREG